MAPRVDKSNQQPRQSAPGEKVVQAGSGPLTTREIADALVVGEPGTQVDIKLPAGTWTAEGLRGIYQGTFPLAFPLNGDGAPHQVTLLSEGGKRVDFSWSTAGGASDNAVAAVGSSDSGGGFHVGGGGSGDAYHVGGDGS
jgi:hypothetical protein